jgi:hypothetical protein
LAYQLHPELYNDDDDDPNRFPVEQFYGRYGDYNYLDRTLVLRNVGRLFIDYEFLNTDIQFDEIVYDPFIERILSPHPIKFILDNIPFSTVLGISIYIGKPKESKIDFIGVKFEYDKLTTVFDEPYNLYFESCTIIDDIFGDYHYGSVEFISMDDVNYLPKYANKVIVNNCMVDIENDLDYIEYVEYEDCGIELGAIPQKSNKIKFINCEFYDIENLFDPDYSYTISEYLELDQCEIDIGDPIIKKFETEDGDVDMEKLEEYLVDLISTNSGLSKDKIEIYKLSY